MMITKNKGRYTMSSRGLVVFGTSYRGTMHRLLSLLCKQSRCTTSSN